MPRHRSGAALLAVASFALFAGCRGDSPRAGGASSAPDSSLARDLELAQASAPAPMVFNDAPVGATAPVSRPAPPRPVAPRPSPVPRRAAPPAPVARAPRPDPAPVAEAPGPVAGIIGAGTRLGMTTNGRVCAATALAGDKFSATVTSETVGSNGAVIPAGSTVVLEVASVEKADPLENSRIEFRVRAIDVDGVPRAATGDVVTLGSLEPVTTSAGNQRTKVIGGAVAGAVLGQIFGRSTKATVIGAAAGAAAGTAAARRGQSSDACLPNGSALQLTLSRDMTIQRER